MTEKEKYEVIEVLGGEYKTTLNKMYRNRKPWKPVVPGHILSFMPGAVEEIKVRPGDLVKKGDSLMIFRAMKMDNNILSPIDGCIKRINVTVGENVPKDALMIEIE